MSNLKLALRQVRFENRSFWRNPAAAFFTFAFPLIFVVLFNALFTGRTLFDGAPVRVRDFYTPALIGFAIVSACYTNIAMGTVIARDNGVLKRVRGTPLPPWAYLFGRIAQSIIVSVLLVVIVTGFSALAYGVRIPTTTIPAFLVALAVGAATFCALGLAVSGLVPNEDAAPAVVNASILPLLFISDVFIPLNHPPAFLRVLSDVFPVKHLSHSLLSAFLHPNGGAGFAGRDLVILGAWGIAGAIAASRYFSWEPRV